MAKYVRLASRKMLSATGGVGSIIESLQGALLIEEFDNWRFFTDSNHLFDQEEFEVQDRRLLQRLQFQFPNLKKFVRVPTTVEKYGGPENAKLTASAHYFPEWFFCPHCDRLDHLKNWRKNWKMILDRNSISRPNDFFNPPRCGYCYDDVKSGKRKGSRYSDLEQVRFIMTAPDGGLRDLPWERWPTVQKNTRDEDSHGGNISVDWNAVCCNRQDLRYLRSKDFADLSGVRIQCKNPECPSGGREKTLAGLFGLRIGRDESKRFKPIIRTSNSAYYPLSFNSLYLPTPGGKISASDRDTIGNMLKAGISREQVYSVLESKYGTLALDDFFKEDPSGAPIFISELQHRLREHQFLLANTNFQNENLAIEEKTSLDIKNYGLGLLLQVKRLKMTSVQTGYTRQEPSDKDIFMRDGDSTVRYTSTKGRQTNCLLASEGFGEGIFIDIDKSRLESWMEWGFAENEEYSHRVNQIFERVRASQHTSPDKFIDIRHFTKFVLLHTLAHLLIREVEFLCGYPASAISERIFVDRDHMQGVLIYTVAGSEGSYGGLLTQALPNNFARLLKSALHRAQECASDPVCFYSEGQGIGENNLAACYSCTLLPETSCEEFNGILDRRLLIDESFGFFTTNRLTF